MDTFFTETGKLKYADGYRLTVEVPQELADYYRSLIPRWKPINKPMWPPHITVVRYGREEPTNKGAWGKYEGDEVSFCYQHYVHEGTVYYWINCFCSRLEKIRVELGLPLISRYTLPPEGFTRCFHITVGNKKEL